jgi:hypothetical protein
VFEALNAAEKHEDLCRAENDGKRLGWSGAGNDLVEFPVFSCTAASVVMPLPSLARRRKMIAYAFAADQETFGFEELLEPLQRGLGGDSCHCPA